jgi:hypothetical protein
MLQHELPVLLMTVIKAYPPNYQDIVAKLPGAKNPNVVFTYGSTIYMGSSPGSAELPADLAAHEAVHTEQQKRLTPLGWWGRYLADPEFRLEQELAAYRVQYKYVQSFASRTQRRMVLSHIVKAMASPIYGNMITREQAKELITAES